MKGNRTIPYPLYRFLLNSFVIKLLQYNGICKNIQHLDYYSILVILKKQL